MPKIKRPQVLSKHSSTSTKHLVIFSLRTKLLLFSGLFLLLLPLIFFLNQSIQLMYFAPDVTSLPVSSKANTPLVSPLSEITIPKVKIALPIYQTKITNGTWSIANDGISHLSESASPGEKGPIILYGHNTLDRFGPIHWLNNGEIITLTTADRKTHTYTIVERVKTSPKELSIFFKRKTETLYLFTCDGLADLDRYIVVAEPTTASSSGSLQGN